MKFAWRLDIKEHFLCGSLYFLVVKAISDFGSVCGLCAMEHELISLPIVPLIFTDWKELWSVQTKPKEEELQPKDSMHLASYHIQKELNFTIPGILLAAFVEFISLSHTYHWIGIKFTFWIYHLIQQESTECFLRFSFSLQTCQQQINTNSLI